MPLVAADRSRFHAQSRRTLACGVLLFRAQSVGGGGRPTWRDEPCFPSIVLDFVSSQDSVFAPSAYICEPIRAWSKGHRSTGHMHASTDPTALLTGAAREGDLQCVEHRADVSVRRLAQLFKHLNSLISTPTTKEYCCVPFAV